MYFNLLDANNNSKYISMTFSFLAAFITTPIMLNVILFEANCHNRTLINRLISSDFESAVCWNLLVQTLIFARYIYGPLPVFFCQMEYLIKNVLIIKVILFLNFIIIIRYIFMFKSKILQPFKIAFGYCF